MDFPNLDGLIATLERKVSQMDAVDATVLGLIGADVERAAKARIGQYQGAAGPFVAWEPLAASTLDGWGGHPGKIALGYAPPDNPELRTGALRDSIQHQTVGATAYVGSDSPVMEYQELGTARMPPRSILGGAAFQQAPHQADHAMTLVVRFLFHG